MVVLSIGLVAVRFGLFGKGQSDAEAIKTAMNDALTAAKEGRPGPVLDFLSDKIAENDTYATSKRQIAAFVKESKPDVSVGDEPAVVSGDSATITTSVRVKAQLMGGIAYEHSFNNVTLLFRKENSVRWLILPSKTWRLTNVTAQSGP